MRTTCRPTPWRFSTLGGLAALALCGGVAGCRSQVASEAGPVQEIADTRSPAPRTAGNPSPGHPAPPTTLREPPTTLRLAPDLLADLKDRVDPSTAARLEAARDAGRAFAQQLGIQGLEAQGIADLFTQLALDVAQAEEDTPAANDERASALQRAAQNAIDGLRWRIPGTALPEAEREIVRWTGDVPFSHPSPAQRERLQRRRQRASEGAPGP